MGGSASSLSPTTAAGVSGWVGTDDDASTSVVNTVTMPADAHVAEVEYLGGCFTLALSHSGGGVDPVATPGELRRVCPRNLRRR